MKQTIGIDIVDVDRITEIRKLQKNTWRHVFTANELSYSLEKSVPEIHLAGCFAAKEAVYKALQSLKLSVKLTDIEIEHTSLNAPVIKLHALSTKSLTVEVSISHTQKTAIAVALVTTK